ncbi:MAG: QueT transporter family protein [Eubacteriales bacterium]|nr:QueT transporter family protein [Eubacteriales bacterium]
MEKSNGYKKITYIAMIAAMYTVLSMAIAPLTFGPVQVRVSEALVLLPIYRFSSVYWVTLGCVITNAIGAVMGINILGPIDIVVGSMATLVAAIITAKLGRYRFKGLPILAAIPPIIINGVVIGYELMLALSDGQNMAIFWTNFASVAVGELLSCLVVGMTMIYFIEKSGLDKKIRSYS